MLSGQLDLDPAGPLLAQPAAARTIVLTAAAAPAGQRARLARAADLIVAGEDSVPSSAAAIAALASRGYRRILAEGGPHLLGQLAVAGLLDELCVDQPAAGRRPGRPHHRTARRAPARPGWGWPTCWPTTATCSAATWSQRG